MLTGGRLTVEDAYAYSKFARAVAAHQRHRLPGPAARRREEAEFLAASVAGATDVTYADVDAGAGGGAGRAGAGGGVPDPVPAAAQGVRRSAGCAVHAVAPFASRGLEKLGATAAATVPGRRGRPCWPRPRICAQALSRPGAILFVGERLATVQGGLSAAAQLAAETGAKLAWVPRRAGDRGAVDAGCLPNLLPGGRPVADAGRPGRAGRGLAAQDRHRSPARPAGTPTASSPPRPPARSARWSWPASTRPTWPTRRLAEQALDKVDFLVSLRDPAHARWPAAPTWSSRSRPAVEKAGTFLDWEGRLRTFDAVLDTTAMTDARVLDALARELGVELGCRRRRRDPPRAGRAAGRPRPSAPAAPPGRAGRRRRGPAPGEAVLATWHQLIDLGSLLDGDEHPGRHRPPAGGAAVARRPRPALGVADGDAGARWPPTGARSRCRPQLTEMPDGVVWLPTNSPGSTVRRTLGVTSGAVVAVGRPPVTPRRCSVTSD